MSQESNRRSRRHAGHRRPSVHMAEKRTEELMNHPSFKYTFVNQHSRGM